MSGLPHVLVVAKAPVVGQVKTRLGVDVGMAVAAELAAASLADTLAACRDAVGPDRCHLSLAGDLAGAVDGTALLALAEGWQVRPQVTGDLGARLAHAVGEVPGPVVQVGMDTPQLTPALLLDAAAALTSYDAMLGPADDGGWWVLAVRDPTLAAALRDVSMSTPTTYDDTRSALEAAGARVGATVRLRDVDTVADAVAVAAAAPQSRFGRAWTARSRVGRVVSLSEESFAAVFTHALRGLPCTVAGLDDLPAVLPVSDWTREADADDRAMLDHCVGPTLDIGCGPGRMAAALAELGHVVLGIDVVHAAVGLTRDRGVSALHRNVFEKLPGEGRWRSALLADGNVGIGGDPVALLTRVRELIDPRGRIVVELAPPGVEDRTVWATLECNDTVSRPFRWSVVGVDDIAAVAAEAGLAAHGTHRVGDRWCAVLVEPS